MTTHAFGAHAADQAIVAMDIQRRAPGPQDVQIDIAYCGVCHSDLHTVRSEWPGTLYPVSYTHLDVYKRQGFSRAALGRGGDHHQLQ